MHDGRMILVEFNELCPPLLEKFMKAGKLPSFSRFYGDSHVYKTLADEVAPYLEPWIQWITVHSGVPFKTHRIENLGDGHNLRAKNLWDLVSDAGGDVWVCGSMNVNHEEHLRGWFLPDPWTTHVKISAELEPYFKFVAAHVTEYTSEKVPLTALDKAAFIAFMARHGLSLSTVTAIVKQLASERKERRLSWKRAVILDKLQMDVFRWRFLKARPKFSTFFLNSTAHFQHLYWRNMAPEQFTLQPSAAEQAIYGDAVLFGYQQMDQILGEFMRLAGDDTTLVLATALSQQPYLKFDGAGGKTVYRPKDFNEFQTKVGIPTRAVAAPVMTQEFHLDFPTAEEAAEAARILLALRYEGVQLMNVEYQGGLKVFAGCRIYSRVPEGAVITTSEGGRTVPFYELFYNIDLVKSGWHHPEGVLWIREPGRAHSVHEGQVSVVDIAPTLCQLLGLEQPATMVGRPIDLAQKRSAA